MSRTQAMIDAAAVFRDSMQQPDPADPNKMVPIDQATMTEQLADGLSIVLADTGRAGGLTKQASTAFAAGLEAFPLAGLTPESACDIGVAKGALRSILGDESIIEAALAAIA